MGGRGGNGRSSAAKPAAASSETQVENAYESLRQGNVIWVGLANLREKLPNMTRAEQDSTLMKMVSERKIRLIPEENQKTITKADEAAGINVSGEVKHLIGIHKGM